MSVTGPSGVGRGDVGAADASEIADLTAGLTAHATVTRGGPSAADVTSLKALQTKLAADGKVDVSDANALVAAAKDSGGVSKSEQSAFLGLLRSSGSAITPAALDVLAKHFGVSLGRPAPAGPATPATTAGVTASVSGLKVLGDQSKGIVGTTTPGSTIEAINLSAAPNLRLDLTDTTVVGKADANGNFKATIPGLAEGDIVRMRARKPDGTTGPWLTMTASGISPKDTRDVEVNLMRINITPNTDGTVSVLQNTDRPFSEPDAKVQFTNSRTGEKQVVALDDDGGIPKDLKLKGKAGDKFSVAATDGRTNTDYSKAIGDVAVQGATTTGAGEPDLGPGDKGYSMVNFHGPLFTNGVSPLDVQQGALGDCFFPATMAAIAQARPDVIQNMVKQNSDGTYTVRFYQDGDKSQPKDVTVDGKLYVRSSGGPLYGESGDSENSPTKMEMWFPIVEKAYSEFKGKGYSAIGNGGNPGDLMSEVLGKYGTDTDLTGANADKVFAAIKAGAAAKKPMAAVTFGDDKEKMYTDTGVYSDHTYSILGTTEKGTQKFVTLRNPWGESVPTGEGDGKTDGIFNMPLADFMKLYESYSVAAAT